MNIVAPRPLFNGDASTVMDNLSVGEGKVRDLGSFNASFAPEKAREREGFHSMRSAPFKPLILSSKGLRKETHRGIQR